MIETVSGLGGLQKEHQQTFMKTPHKCIIIMLTTKTYVDLNQVATNFILENCLL